MKKIRLIPALIGVMAANLGHAGAATFSGAVNGGIDLSIVTTNGPAGTNAKVLETILKVPGSKKDLLIGVSIESGVLTQTQVKGKAGSTTWASASGSVDIKVLIDGEEVAPGVVTFNHRAQTLEATLGGVIDSCTDANGDGVIDVDLECTVTDEMIGLLLDTTSANHFNFIAPNVGPGDHIIEVVADVSAAADSSASGGGTAQGKAVINIGSLSVEVVRSANTLDGITLE